MSKTITFLLFLYVGMTTSYIKSISLLPLYTPLSSKLQSNKLTRMSLQMDKCTNISSIIKTSEYYITNPLKKEGLQNLPYTSDQINISSIYLNIDKVKGVYFSKDVKNVNNNDKNKRLYRISNNTRINMKNLQKFTIQSFNNSIDGILF